MQCVRRLQFEYVYNLEVRDNDTGTSLPITAFFVPLMPGAGDVVAAGFIGGDGTVAPSQTTIVEGDPGNPP